MKLTRLAPILSAVVLLSAGSAFADQVEHCYGVGSTGLPILTNSAVIGSDCCDMQPAVIDTSCDPYLPLWQQATLDTARRWGVRACNVPCVSETAPVTLDTLTLGAVIQNGCGDKLIQPAIVNGPCGNTFGAPIGCRTFTAPNCNTCGSLEQSAIIDDGPNVFPATLPPIHVMAQPAVINSRGCP
jgi:hypothetical protein